MSDRTAVPNRDKYGRPTRSWRTRLNLPRFPITLADGTVALGVRPGPGMDLAKAVRGMGLTTGVPTLVLVGAGTRPAQVARLGPLLEKVVVKVADTVTATVVDEGTRGGVAGLLGQVRTRREAGFPLLGVAPDDGRDSGHPDPRGLPTAEHNPDGWELDPGHTHFVLVPAHDDAGVARWVSTVAYALAGGNRSVALVAAGGEPAWASVAEHVRAQRVVMAVARSGGVADHLSAALAGRPADSRAVPLARSGQVCSVDPGKGAAYVAEVLAGALSRPDALGPGPTPA